MLPLPSALRWFAICCVLLVGGCSTYSLPGSDPVPAETQSGHPPITPPPTSPQTAPAAPEPNASGAYRGLLDKAELASARGDYEQALALLERAQRIDPDSGDIYLELAKTYAAKGDNRLASATAERGLLYCDGPAQCDALRDYIP